RAEAAGDEQQVGAQTVPDRLPQLGGAVADDRDRARLEPERDRLASVERPVQVGTLAADELAARDEDGRARPAQRLSVPRRRRASARRSAAARCGVPGT